jgi:hypothetical protein
LPFSRRERAAEICQNANDFARESVGWNGVLAAGYNGIVLDRRIFVMRRAAKAPGSHLES